MTRKFRKASLCLVLAILLIGSTWASAAQTVTAGKRTLKLVSVPMDGSCVGQIVIANNSIHSDEPASALVQAGAAKTGNTVVAAINGMFFNSYYNKKQPLSFPDNVPLMLTNLVQDGRTIVCGGEQNCIGFTKDGQTKIDRVNVKTSAYIDGRGPVLIWCVNGKDTAADAVILITEEVTLPYTVADGSTAFLIENNVVTRQLNGGAVTLTAGQQLLVFNSGATTSHAGWNLLPTVGGGVAVKTELLAKSGDDWSDVTSVAGGGRMLVHEGQVVSADAAYNAALDQDPKQSATSVQQRSFAAIMSDRSVLLGTGTASFNEIAAYLQARGAKDAISLDGGASSMLYENGTYVTPAGRQLASVIVFTRPTAKAAACPALVDGKEMTFDAYNIQRNNYFKLRDFALAVSGSEKQFDVQWDKTRNAIALTSGSSYTVIGGEMSGETGIAPSTLKLNQAPIYKDGELCPLTAYTINGNNYFKLRDLGKAFDISVRWDSATSSVLIDTTQNYSD